MKNDNVRKNYESRKLEDLASVMKKMAVSALLLGSCMNAQALVITAENGTVCPKEAVILNPALSSDSAVTWQKKVDGSWVDVCLLKVEIPFIYEMEDHDMEFRALEKSGTIITAESNTIKIIKGTDCVPEGHYSSTGDFITGTDFDPTGRNTGRLEQDVENFFGEYTLEFSKSECDYTIGGLKSSFGDYIPSIDDSVRREVSGQYENYFMNLTNPNCNFAEIRFPAMPNNCDRGYDHHGVSYRNQNYRFVMRAYIKPTCKMDESAAFHARTGHGTVTQDRMDVKLYDDVTGELLGSKFDLKSSNNVADVKISSLTNVNNLPMTGGEYHMLRFEITFYGYMPYVNEGLTHYLFTPEFSQFACANVSIDHMSAEVENVCLSQKIDCVGGTVLATATGFPKDAEYTWYEKFGEEWQSLNISGQGDEYRTANILVNFVGAKEYKVEVNKGDGTATVTKEFTVYGKDCESLEPKDTTEVCKCDQESYISSTGDFISGTDFTPTGKNTGKLEQDVENFFGDYSLEFYKGDCVYTIGGLQSSFGGYVPSIDDSVKREKGDQYENYFLNLTNPNCIVADIRFPASNKDLSYRNQNYRFVMRAYIKPTCKMDESAAFHARTGHGTVTQDRMDVKLYDDVTGELLGSKSELSSSNNLVDVRFNSLTNVQNLPMTGGEYHMLRFDVTFYGYMPYVNAGLLYYAFTTEFSQFACAKIAIDYMSVEVESVCLSHKQVCKGDTVRAVAAGFPKSATYTWYERSGEEWLPMLNISGQGDAYRTANILVDIVGAKEYKVEVNKGDGSETVTKEFTVYGKESSLETINVCLGDTVHATVEGYPMNAIYTWYEKTEEEWNSALGISGPGEYTTDILVDFVGTREYKVEVDNGDGSAPKTKRFIVIAIDCDSILHGDTTGVKILELSGDDPIVNVCTVEGYVLKTNVKLSEALVELKRGVYIIGGKKYYISK